MTQRFLRSQSSISLLTRSAVSNHPVGLDAEWSKREVDLGMAPLVLSGLELADLDRAPEARRAQRFLEYWTLKEAFIKATGRGLSQPLGRFWFHLRETQEPEINFARGEQYHAKLWRFAQPKELSPSHEIAVAVSLPPGQKRTLDASSARRAATPCCAQTRTASGKHVSGMTLNK